MTAEEAKGLAGFLLAGIEREFQITRKVMAAVPETRLDFKLGDKGRTTRELMAHIAEAEPWFAEGIASGNFAYSQGAPPATVQEILARFDKDVPAAIAKVRALSSDQLAKPINFLGLFNLPAVYYLQFWLSHTIHHRGQLSTYLRAMNAHVPSIYGGSADDPFQMATAQSSG